MYCEPCDQWLPGENDHDMLALLARHLRIEHGWSRRKTAKEINHAEKPR